MTFSIVLRSNQPLTRLPLSATGSPPPIQKHSTSKNLPSHDSQKEELELLFLTFTQKCLRGGETTSFPTPHQDTSDRPCQPYLSPTPDEQQVRAHLGLDLRRGETLCEASILTYHHG